MHVIVPVCAIIYLMHDCHVVFCLLETVLEGVHANCRWLYMLQHAYAKI